MLYDLLSCLFALAVLAHAQTSSVTATFAPVYAPIPSGASGPPISNITGYRVEDFGQGAYMVTDGIYQALFFVACESVLVVDAPPTIGHKLLRAIRTVTELPISHVIYSHAHADHIGAAYLFKDNNVTFIAHQETEALLYNDAARPAPNITFSDELDLAICNQTLHLSYKGPNHEPGNIFIYAPLRKILMLVDVVFPGWVPFDALAESQSVPGFIRAHDQLLEYDFEHYIGGHLNRAGTRKDVVIQREYITQLFDNCAEAIRLSAAPPNATNPLSVQTSLVAVEAANLGNPWALFYVYEHDVLAGWCGNKTIAAWLGRLAGVDVYTPDNAVTMINSLRIDFGLLGPFGVTDS
ncbi:MAG: hypothetical protein Q9220_000399 [cf. Caloplaca sp. 1 TL-2023]